MTEYLKHAGSCRNVQSRWLGNPRGVVGFVWAGTLLFLFFPFYSYSQKTKSDSITQFKVRYSNGDYKFFPEDSYLFMNSRNKLKITNTKGKKFEVKLMGGAIKKNGSDSLFVIDGLIKPGNVLICIYETDVKGKKKLVLNKPFSVVSFPKVKFGGVACDSAMPALMLAAGTFNMHYAGLKMKVPVSSFKMEFYKSQKFILDSSANNRLSKKMLAYVEKLKPGSLIYLSDIKYKDPNGTEHTEPVYRVFIIKDKEIIKFGVNN